MATPLLRTKLYIPLARPDLVPRPRLIERLNAALDYKLTLVSAPAGFGKTTLLSEWIHQRAESKERGDETSTNFLDSFKVAWISLDKGDNDPARFLAYFVTAVQTVYADVGDSVLTALQSTQHPPIEALVTGLINEITEILSRLVIVLDDYHVIVEQQIHDALTFLLDNLPPQMHLVLSSRADPPWPFARMRARREVTELRADDLRFTSTEAAAFLNDVMGLGLAPQDITALDTRTEGWIVGLQLAALSMQGHKDVTVFVQAFGGSHRFILDYLVEEVLSRQSTDVQEFLLKTSILERMTAPLCDAIVGKANSQNILVQLGRNNLFLVPLDDERRWYRYHRLFGDLLRSRLEETQPDLSILYRRASEWCQAAELVEEAVTYALTGGDMKRAASLVEQNAMRMLVQGEIITLSWWLDALPDDLVRVRPWLSVYRAWTQYWIGRREQAEECLQNAEQALRGALVPSEAERQRIAGHIAVIRAYNALVYEDVSRVLEMAQRALELLPEGEYMRCMAALILGGANWGLGDVVAAQRAFTEASTAAQKCGYPFLAVSAACYAGMQQAKQALLYEASETYRRALELMTGPEGREPPASGFPLVRLGDLSREWNDLETAHRNLVKGVELCAQWGQADIQADSHIALARLQLAQQDWEKATSTLRKAEQLVHRTKPDPWITCWLDACRLRLWLLVGDLDAVIRWAQTSGLGVDDELSYQHDLHHINLARVLVAQGTQQLSGPYLDKALDLLARLLQAAETAGWINEVIRVLILQALAFEARDEGEEALAALSRALTLAEPGGYVRTFIDEGAPMGRLLSRFLETWPEGHKTGSQRAIVQYARKLLVVLGSEETGGRSPTKTSLPTLVEPLSEREMQVLRLLTTSLSSTEIAKELFVATSTARSHIKNIYRKLDVHRRIDAIQRAKELGLL